MTQPRRDDDVAAWLKARRDAYDKILDFGCWNAVDYLLDEWRLRADTGTALADPFPEER